MAGAVSERIGLGWCDNIDKFNPQDVREIERQRGLLRDVFDIPQYSLDPRKTAILTGVATIVAEICERGGDVREFMTFQNKVIDLPDYAFLGEPYPGFNVNGWAIFYAFIDPLTYGRKIHRSVEQRGASGKR